MENTYATLLRITRPLKRFGLRHLRSVPGAHAVIAMFLPHTAEVNGYRFHLDSHNETMTMQLASGLIEEPFETELMRKFVRRGDIVVDIGACIGYYTVLFSRLVGEEGLVYAYEPTPRSFSILSKNVQENRCTNVVLVNGGLSDKNEDGAIFINKYNRGDNQIYASKGRESVPVVLHRLDDIFSREVHLIKMDIQGAEGLALRGMVDTIRAHRPLIVTELWPDQMEKAGATAAEFLGFLEQNGYSFSLIDEEMKQVRSVTKDQLLKKEGYKRFCNIICRCDVR